MKYERLRIADVVLFMPRIFSDSRGHFLETWHAERYREGGITDPFVQDNVSVSHAGVLRGLHFQNPTAQGKLVSCLSGAVFDVAVDVRIDSPTFGQWVGAELTAQNGHQLWVPKGFAHGFQVLSEQAVFAYKCTAYYTPASEQSIRWDDPAIGINWPGSQAILSEKDASAPLLSLIPHDRLPRIQSVDS